MRLAGAVVLLSLPALALDAGRWRWSRAIDVPAGKGYAALELDMPCFSAAARADLGDLRLKDAAGGEVPYKLTVSRDESGAETVPSVVTDVSSAGGQTSFLVDAGAGLRTHGQVEIRTDDMNFRRSVRIEASDDRKTWALLRDRAVIYDVSADYRARHLSVDYPASTRRWLRVTVLGAPPMPVQGAQLRRELKRKGERSLWSPASARRSEEGRTTVWEIDMGREGVPVSALALGVTGENFSRAARIELHEEKDGASVRRQAAAGTLWRFRLPAASGERTTLEFPELRARRFRLVVDNGDNPPLTVFSLRVLGPKHSLHFPSDRPRPYQLLAGRARLSPPAYDLAAFAGYLDLGKAAPARFSEARFAENLGYSDADGMPWSERRPALFWAVLAGAAGFLLWVTLRRARELAR